MTASGCAQTLVRCAAKAHNEPKLTYAAECTNGCFVQKPAAGEPSQLGLGWDEEVFVSFPQNVLLHFPHRIAWQFRHHEQLTWMLETCE